MVDAWYSKLQTILPLLQVRVFLQGPYAGSGLMSTNINSNLPSVSPYQDSNNNSAYLNGSNYVVVPYTIPSNITDWVQIEIRGSDKATVVESKSCFLRDDGQVIDPDGFSENISLGSSVVNPISTYYIVVKHRNHLAVMSADLVELNGLTSYDFTTGNDKYYGGSSGAIQLETGVWGMIAGDANSDGSIDAVDKNNIWRVENGTTWSYTKYSDFNLDGNLDAVDKNNFWRPNNGLSSQVP